jgi:hypothetical protein
MNNLLVTALLWWTYVHILLVTALLYNLLVVPHALMAPGYFTSTALSTGFPYNVLSLSTEPEVH